MLLYSTAECCTVNDFRAFSPEMATKAMCHRRGGAAQRESCESAGKSTEKAIVNKAKQSKALSPKKIKIKTSSHNCTGLDGISDYRHKKKRTALVWDGKDDGSEEDHQNI